MGVVIGDRGFGGGRSMINARVNSEAAVYHCGIYCESPHIKAVHKAEKMTESSRFMWWWYQYFNQGEEGNGTSEGEESEVVRQREKFSLKEL